MLYIVIVVFIFVNCPATGAARNGIFTSWEDVLNAPYSDFFYAQISDMHSSGNYVNNHPWLYEELLFVQSNTRILVCQDPKGELRYAALPTQVYPVPTNQGIPNGPGYGPGMYYHFDEVEMMNIRYSFRPDGSDTLLSLINEGDFNRTYYANHFLPVTRGMTRDIESAIISFAPVSSDPEKAALSPAPLPGPPGAFYILYLKNTGEKVIEGSILLTCEKSLHYQKPLSTIDRNTLILSVPEASTGIHMIGGTWSEDPENFIATKDIRINPGESILIESFIVLGERYKEIMPVVYQLYFFKSLEWLDKTADFWKKRLGNLEVGSEDYPIITKVSRDIYYRCIIDNFCCLQTNADGNLIAHYQGVPKQGTIWGIDYEPTIISAMHVAPELGRSGICFTMDRNYAPITEYGSEHSVPILISPVMIARKYLELTGDIGFFKEHSEIVESLDRTMKDLLSLKSREYTLFPTRYSSDGPVGRKYDHGTNVKVYYALEGYGLILDALGEKEKAQDYHKLAAELSKAIDQTMVTDGPFGRQISGGTNLGEDPGDFYLNDSIIYYDGEDTGSHLAPLYGVYGWDYTPWVNYHRWARSIFCPSYEPEFGTIRWFPSWSMPVLDGTGWISTLGGSVSRPEMAENMEQLYNICDPSAALYWWPFGYNFKQGLSRCSQGQGTWAWQYLEQWLGIKLNAMTRTLTISPLGLPDSIQWEQMPVGNYLFDISWQEKITGAECKITNHNRDTWTINIGCRPYRTGTGGKLIWKIIKVLPGQTASVILKNDNSGDQIFTEDNIIPNTEIEKLADKDGIVFIRYGTVDPFPGWYHLWVEEMLDVRFYIVNGTNSDWEETTLILNYPEGWLAKGRKPGYWEKPEGLEMNQTSIDLGVLPVMKSMVAPFMVKGPHLYDHDFLTEGMSKHFPAEQGPALKLPTSEVSSILSTGIEAILRIKTKDGKQIEKKLNVPVNIVPIVR